MDCSEDLLELDSETSRINILRDSDPFLPVLHSLEISEEHLEDGLNTPAVTPLQSPQCISQGVEVAFFTTTCSAYIIHPS